MWTIGNVAFATLIEALAWARRERLAVAIRRQGRIVASWSPVGGFRLEAVQ